MNNEPCGEFKPAKDDSDVCENCRWIEYDHKTANALYSEWLESTKPPERNMETPAEFTRAQSLIGSTEVTLAQAVPLDAYEAVVKYAKWLESMCEQYRERACEHLTKDEEGKSVCGLIFHGVGIE